MRVFSMTSSASGEGGEPPITGLTREPTQQRRIQDRGRGDGDRLVRHSGADNKSDLTGRKSIVVGG